MIVPYQTQIILSLEVIGIAGFSFSGALAARKAHMDFFGVMVLTGVTAVGGGVLRDIILNVPSILFFESTHYLYVCVICALIVLFFSHHVEKYLNRLILLFDSVGLAIFTALGTLRALSAGAPMLSAILFATITACGGSVLRDLLRNERPYLLYGDFYAMASFLGSAIMLVMMFQLKIAVNIASVTCVIFVFLLRIVVLYSQTERVKNSIIRRKQPMFRLNKHLKPQDEAEIIKDAISQIDFSELNE